MVVNDFLAKCLPNRYRSKNKIHLIASLLSSLTQADNWDDGFYLWIKHLIVPRAEWNTFSVSKYAGAAVEYIIKRVWKRVPMSKVHNNICQLINTIDIVLLRNVNDWTYHENWLKCYEYMLRLVVKRQKRLPLYITNIFYNIAINFKSNVRTLFSNPNLFCRYLQLFSKDNFEKYCRLDLMFCYLIHKFMKCNLLPLYETVYFRYIMKLDLINLNMMPIRHETICKFEDSISNDFFRLYKDVLMANSARRRKYFNYNGWCPRTLRVLRLAKFDMYTKMLYLKAKSKPRREDDRLDMDLVHLSDIKNIM